MRVSCGTDVVDVGRIEKSIKTNARFAKKVFTDNEIEYCENKKAGRYESYAARFAAKEAFLKAMGTGLFEGASLTDIEVVNETGPIWGSGAPSFKLSGAAADIYRQRGGASLSLSISHTAGTALAMVVALFED